MYLGVFVASLAGTVPLILCTERGRLDRGAFVLSVALLGLSQALLALDQGSRWSVLGALAVFFAAFNYLEARLPALLTTFGVGPGSGGCAGHVCDQPVPRCICRGRPRRAAAGLVMAWRACSGAAPGWPSILGDHGVAALGTLKLSLFGSFAAVPSGCPVT